jgi:uroporphyrinogen-III decarboxylase
VGGGDLASTKGMLYSPKIFQKVVLPAYKFMLQQCHDSDVHYIFRSDGNLWSIMDMLFSDARCPGYGETDREASMTLGTIRKKFPKLVVWGNVSSSLLHHGTVEEVRIECERIREESGETAYFQGCSNLIMNGTPPENVEMMYSIR